MSDQKIDVMVSIRMPKSLANELKQLTEEMYFLDLSEHVRSVVRQKWMEMQNPQLSEIKKLREDIEAQVRRKSAEKIQEEVARELEKIKEQLKRGLDVK
jgi:Arc/MetJ-type ribon-helix-helix transcriptional regulator